MDKKKVAKIFVDSFKTDIKEVILEGELKGCGGTAENRKRYEVIFTSQRNSARFMALTGMKLGYQLPIRNATRISTTSGTRTKSLKLMGLSSVWVGR